MRSPYCACLSIYLCIPNFFCFLCGMCHIRGKYVISAFQNSLFCYEILPVASVAKNSGLGSKTAAEMLRVKVLTDKIKNISGG
jgi:hypothetical protein